MPERRVMQLPFGAGLDRESGVLAVAPGSMEDLRNVLMRRGKVVVRKGVESKLAFLAEDDQTPVTHILAGQSLRGERAGVVVGYQGDDANPHAGAVYIYRLDAEATTQKRLAKWFTVSDPANADPPSIITAEQYGKAFFAHDEPRVNEREPTQVYDPFAGTLVQDLTGAFRDIDGDGDREEEPIRFRGVVADDDYLWGWGFGTAGEDRPEYLRFSKPGQPSEFLHNAYFPLGGRRDPITACEPTEDVLVVLKEAENYRIHGDNWYNFGRERMDEAFGCLAGRLSVSVAGAVFFWSDDGPRMTTGGPTQDISPPLELDGFEPSSLPARGEISDGFAAYIPEEKVVVWVFGQRVYCLSLRGGLENMKWSYWTLGFQPQCGFTLFASGLGAPTESPPAGYPEWLRNGSNRGDDEIKPVWRNEQPTGDVLVELHYREAENLAGAAYSMAVDDDGNGIANEYSAVDDAAHTTARSIDRDGQRVEVTGSTGAADSGVERVITGVEAGKAYTFTLEIDTDSMTGGAGALYRIIWEDNGGVQQGSVTEVGPEAGFPEFRHRHEYDLVAPAGATQVRVQKLVRTAASGETGIAWFRDFMSAKVEAQGEWTRDRSVPVELPDGSEQDAAIDGFSPGTFCEVALRYRRGLFYTSGYESADPDDWPEKSKGVATTPVQTFSDPEITDTWFTIYTDINGNYLLGHDLDIQITEDVYDAWVASQQAGLSPEVEVHRQVTRHDDGGLVNGNVTESSLTLHETITGSPFTLDEGGGTATFRYSDQTIYTAYHDQAETWKYKARVIIPTATGTFTSGFSPTVDRWPGRFGAPDITDVAQNPGPSFDSLDSPNGDGGSEALRVGWSFDDGFANNACEPRKSGTRDELTSFIPGDPPAKNQQFFDAHTVIQFRNVSTGGNWTDAGYEDCNSPGSFEGVADIESLVNGDDYEVRARHRVRLGGATNAVALTPWDTFEHARTA